MDIGQNLPVPEWVPFRLTRFMLDTFGGLGPWGLFLAEMVSIGKKL